MFGQEKTDFFIIQDVATIISSKTDDALEPPLLFVLLSGVALLGVLPLDATGAAAAERRLQREVDVLLRVQTHNEAGNVDDLQRKRNLAFTRAVALDHRLAVKHQFSAR